MEVNMSPTFKQFLQDKTVNADKKLTILSTIQCKNNWDLPQAGNDQTNIQQRTCGLKRDVLQSRNTV